MSVDEHAPRGAPDAATARHVRAMRRQWRWYGVILAAVLLATAAMVGVVWANSETAHAHLHTARAAPPSVPYGTIATSPKQAWRSGDATAIGAPFAGGTVVTYSRHTVTGRAALTGAPDWTYTRSDRTVCQVMQAEGKTIAVFDNGGSCDEVDTFDTATGKRAWDRTLDENGMTITGRPSMIATSDTAFFWAGNAIYAIDPDSGYDRWTLTPDDGCTFTHLVSGSSGVLVSEHCVGTDQLLLRDRYAAYDDKQKTEDKKQQIIWRRQNTSTIPAAADTFVAALDPATRQLVRYDAKTGKPTGHTALAPRPGATGPVRQAAAADAELIGIAGRCYALDASGAGLLWTAPLGGLPTVSAKASGGQLPGLRDALLLLPAAGGGAAVEALDGATGKVRATYPVPAPAAGSRVYPLGTGFLVAGTSTTVYQ